MVEKIIVIHLIYNSPEVSNDLSFGRCFPIAIWQLPRENDLGRDVNVWGLLLFLVRQMITIKI